MGKINFSPTDVFVDGENIIAPVSFDGRRVTLSIAKSEIIKFTGDDRMTERNCETWVRNNFEVFSVKMLDWMNRTQRFDASEIAISLEQNSQHTKPSSA